MFCVMPRQTGPAPAPAAPVAPGKQPDAERTTRSQGMRPAGEEWVVLQEQLDLSGQVRELAQEPPHSHAEQNMQHLTEYRDKAQASGL